MTFYHPPDTKEQLEFAWDRPWNMGNRSCLNSARDKKWEGDGMLTHMLAYKLYDIPNTCGPDWDVCATFDFERPVAPPITDSNVAERSLTLLDQYRKKHLAFSHNNLLVPLGDDFKYKTLPMTEKIMDNYARLFAYLNADASLKVRIRFATLSEYFQAVKKRFPAQELPRYDQDFFTYSDRDNDYWSGYYTTRPYLKKAIRTTQSKLRASQILFVTARPLFSVEEFQVWFEDLRQCSQTLGLLQHHDAVTGTAKQVVADDYIRRLLLAQRTVAEWTTKIGRAHV